MRTSGRYAKGAIQRDAILSVALEVFAEGGYRGTSLREIARRCDLSLTGVMHYFESKEHLFTEVIRRRDTEARAKLVDRTDAIDGIVDAMLYNTSTPGLVALYATLVAASADENHPAHEYIEQHFDEARSWVATVVETLRQEGRVASNVHADAVAVDLVAIVEGLQLQWLIDRSIDLSGRTRAAFEAYLGVAPVGVAEARAAFDAAEHP